METSGISNLMVITSRTHKAPLLTLARALPGWPGHLRYYVQKACDRCVIKSSNSVIWPAPGSADTELGVLMGPEVSHGEAKIYARVQA
jgi:hypothetical protein